MTNSFQIFIDLARKSIHLGLNFFYPKLTLPKLFQTERTRLTHLLSFARLFVLDTSGCLLSVYQNCAKTLSNHSVQAILQSIAASSLRSDTNQPRSNRLIQTNSNQFIHFKNQCFLKGYKSVNQLPTGHPHMKHLTV